MLLAIDTSTFASSIALFDERGIVGETTWRTHENHTRSLMPEIISLLGLVGTDTASLVAIAAATGPGSFTGLRIGLSAAKGLAFSLNAALLGVPTLDVSAKMASDADLPVCAILQAGRARFGAAVYENKQSAMRRIGDYFFGTAEEIALQAYNRLSARQKCFVIGELDESVRTAFQKEFGQSVLLASDALNVRRAGFLAALAWQRWREGGADDLHTLAPYYIPTPSVS